MPRLYIDNHIDNGWILILQQIEIQPFIFYYLCDMIDKASWGLDKRFFVLENDILLCCEPKGMHKPKQRTTKHSIKNKKTYNEKAVCNLYPLPSLLRHP